MTGLEHGDTESMGHGVVAASPVADVEDEDDDEPRSVTNDAPPGANDAAPTADGGRQPQ